MAEKKVVLTRNVQKAIKVYAKKALVAPSECDFTLKKVQTLVKTKLSEDFEHITKEQLASYLDKQKILNEHISFKQEYTLVLFRKEKKEITLFYTIEYGRYSTHPKLLLLPTSIIPYKEYKPTDLLKLLYREFNKIKAQNRILIQVFEASMVKTLKGLVKYIYAKKFTKKVKIPLFDGIAPVIARESKVIIWFEHKEKKGMVTEVDVDEILIEYKKPIYGRNGLNAFGENIDTEYAVHHDEPDIEIDPDSIRIEESKTSKRYISRVRGYVHYDGNSLSVDNSLMLQKVSRNREIIDSDDEANNINIVVSQKDTTKDSIGEGVELHSESIHVEGFVGAGSRLEAQTLKIDGATHQDSKQFAKFATINRHKGTLRCHEANIKLLEGGVVHATKVVVEGTLGGEIYAQDVTITSVKNNLKVYAANSITIRLVSGEDNHFIINSQKVSVLQSKIEFLKEEIEELRYKLKQAERFYPDQVESIKAQLKEKRAMIKAINESYKEATITIEHPLRGLNHIVFTIDKDHELHYKTDAKAYEPFHLEIIENVITLLPPAISLEIE